MNQEGPALSASLPTMPTIWRVPDGLWAVVQPVLDVCDAPKRTGRRRIDPRAALDAIIFRLRSGCQWNRLPRESPDDSSVHRTFRRWVRAGVLEHVWAVLVEQCAELGGVDWAWQAADAALGKARSGGITWGGTPRIAARRA
jgi:putative transposase